MRDPHPASPHVADLGLMVAAGTGGRDRHRADRRGRGLGGGAGVTKLELHVFPHNEPAIALYEKLGYEREGSGAATTARRRAATRT